MVRKYCITLLLSLTLFLPNKSKADGSFLINLAASIFGGIDFESNRLNKQLKKQNQEVKNCVKKLDNSNKDKDLSWKLNKCNAVD